MPRRLLQTRAQNRSKKSGARAGNEHMLPTDGVRQHLPNGWRDRVHAEVRRAEEAKRLCHPTARRDVRGHRPRRVESHHHSQAPAHLREVEQRAFVIDEQIDRPGDRHHEVAESQPMPSTVAIDQPADQGRRGDRRETFYRDCAPNSCGVHTELGREKLGKDQIEGPREPKQRNRGQQKKKLARQEARILVRG